MVGARAKHGVVHAVGPLGARVCRDGWNIHTHGDMGRGDDVCAACNMHRKMIVLCKVKL